MTSKKNTTTYARVVPNVETKPTWFVPTCHYCGVKGHIRPRCPSWGTKHVPYEFITSHVKSKSPKVVHSSKFNPVCHHCGEFGHIRPYCHKLNRVSRSYTHQQPRNDYKRLKNHIRVLTNYVNRFALKPRHVPKNHGKRRNNNAKARPRTPPIPHEFIDTSKVTVMWVRKSDLESLRTPKKFVGEDLVE